MIRAIHLPLRKRNQDDDTRRSEENEFQGLTLSRLTLPAFRRKHQECLSAEQPFDSLRVRGRRADLLVEQTADP